MMLHDRSSLPMEIFLHDWRSLWVCQPLHVVALLLTHHHTIWRDCPWAKILRLRANACQFNARPQKTTHTDQAILNIRVNSSTHGINLQRTEPFNSTRDVRFPLLRRREDSSCPLETKVNMHIPSFKCAVTSPTCH